METQNNQYAHMVEATNDLQKRGFTTQFSLENDKLRSLTTDKLYSPTNVSIHEFHRFEGITNPSDQSIVHAIEAGDEKGVIIDSYGSEASADLAHFLEASTVLYE